MPTAVSADGKRHMFPEGTEQGIIDRVMKEYASPGSSLPAEPGFTTDRGNTEQDALAQARAGDVVPENVPGPKVDMRQVFEKKSALEQQLKAQGKNPWEDEQWKGLARQLGTGQAQTATEAAKFAALPEANIAGKLASAGEAVGRGASAVKAAMPGAKEAVAREGGEALRGEGVAHAETQIARETARAAARPVDTSAQQAAARDSGGRVGAARTAASEANARVAAAEERQRIAGTRLAGVDKYAAGEKSTSAIRSARKEFEDSNRELIQAKAARDQAATGRAMVEREGAAAQRDLRGAQSEASKAAKGAEGAQKIADKYSTLRNQIATEPDPKRIATQADQLFNDLRRSGLITDAKHTELIQQVDKVRSQVKDAEVARARLTRIMRHALVYGTAGVGAETAHVLWGIL